MSYDTRRLLAQKIRLLRKTHGWSQEVLAEACGLHRTYIGAIERCERNISVDNLSRIAAALDTDIASLFIQAENNPLFPHQIREVNAGYSGSLPFIRGKIQHQQGQISL